jgi:transposase
MRAYSLDLRQRIVAAVDAAEGTLADIAHLFHVSVSCITRLLQRRREAGSLAPKPHAGGPRPKLTAHDEQRLLALLHQQPDATLTELRDRLGVPCSIMTIARALRRHRITRKKKTPYADQRDSPEVQTKRRAFRKKLATVDPKHLVFVDEMGATTKLTRTYGRAPQGARVYQAVPGQWQSVTLIAGLRLSGVTAPFAFAGSTDGPTFGAYVEEVLVPQLHRGDVVIWDNLQPHKMKAAVGAVEGTGATVLPAPPWSPDLIPIEEMFSKVKEGLRALAARTTKTVYAALGVALDGVCRQDILSWFQDCGLCANHT